MHSSILPKVENNPLKTCFMCSVDKCFGFLIPPHTEQSFICIFSVFFFISVSNAFCQVLLHNFTSALCEKFAMLSVFLFIFQISGLKACLKNKKNTHLFLSALQEVFVCVCFRFHWKICTAQSFAWTWETITTSAMIAELRTPCSCGSVCDRGRNYREAQGTWGKRGEVALLNDDK